MYRVLLADDEGIMLESLKKIITKNFGTECELACAKTGRAVVELAETFRPDIAFMVIQMPGINGHSGNPGKSESLQHDQICVINSV